MIRFLFFVSICLAWSLPLLWAQARYIDAEDYPVSTETIYDSYTKVDGNLTVPLGGIIFRNDSLGQVLAFDMYTDGLRNIIYHFYKDSIPEQILIDMYLNDTNGADISGIKNLHRKKVILSHYSKKSKRLGPRYFTTCKGVRLGISQDSVLRVYGTPVSQKTSKGYTIIRWEFQGDFLASIREKKKNIILVRDSYGQEITAYIKDNRLMALHIENTIP